MARNQDSCLRLVGEKTDSTKLRPRRRGEQPPAPNAGLPTRIARAADVA